MKSYMYAAVPYKGTSFLLPFCVYFILLFHNSVVVIYIYDLCFLGPNKAFFSPPNLGPPPKLAWKSWFCLLSLLENSGSSPKTRIKILVYLENPTTRFGRHRSSENRRTTICLVLELSNSRVRQAQSLNDTTLKETHIDLCKFSF